MNDELLTAKRFAKDLNRLACHPKMFKVNREDEEYRSLLELARHLMEIDFSTEVGNTEELLKQMLKGEESLIDLDGKLGELGEEGLSEDELSEEDLSKISAATDKSYEDWINFRKS